MHPLCEPRLPRLVQPYCRKCAEPDETAVCSWCRAEAPAYERIRAPYRYTGPVRDMVHDLKYSNIRALAPTLGGLLADYLESQRFAADVLAPVPLHPKRERSRGYNQSHLLAREVSRRIQVPMADDRLLRTVDTPPQVSMSGRGGAPQEHRRRIRVYAGRDRATGPADRRRRDDRQHDVGLRLRAEGSRGHVGRWAGASPVAATPGAV